MVSPVLVRLGLSGSLGLGAGPRSCAWSLTPLLSRAGGGGGHARQAGPGHRDVGHVRLPGWAGEGEHGVCPGHVAGLGPGHGDGSSHSHSSLRLAGEEARVPGGALVTVMYFSLVLNSWAGEAEKMGAWVQKLCMI